MLTSKKGMSALQIQRDMGFGSYETAHSMCHKIRAALIEPEAKLGGIVEVDETYIGGKDKNKHVDKRSGGAAACWLQQDADHRRRQPQGQRHRPRAWSRYQGSAESFVREVVSDKVSLLATDESNVYGGLADYPHGTVHHAARQYVVGAVHTNTIEGFWSIFKRGIVGSFHKVSRKYLPLYVAEFQFRYNNRHNPDIFGEAHSRVLRRNKSRRKRRKRAR